VKEGTKLTVGKMHNVSVLIIQLKIFKN